MQVFYNNYSEQMCTAACYAPVTKHLWSQPLDFAG